MLVSVLRFAFLHNKIHAQMVDRLDDGVISADLAPLDYKGLYKAIYDEDLNSYPFLVAFELDVTYIC